MTKQREIECLRELYATMEKDLVNMTVQAYFYRKEAENSVHIGKQQAEESLATYEKRIAYIKENLQAYVMYASEVLKTEL